jgi:hypothetical protein
VAEAAPARPSTRVVVLATAALAGVALLGWLGSMLPRRVRGSVIDDLRDR